MVENDYTDLYLDLIFRRWNLHARMLQNFQSEMVRGLLYKDNWTQEYLDDWMWNQESRVLDLYDDVSWFQMMITALFDYVGFTDDAIFEAWMRVANREVVV